VLLQPDACHDNEGMPRHGQDTSFFFTSVHALARMPKHARIVLNGALPLCRSGAEPAGCTGSPPPEFTGPNEGFLCDVMQLSQCASASAGKGAPSPSCCAKLKSHGPSCLCRYKDDTNLKLVFDARHKRQVLTGCKVPAPNCSSRSC
jgi:hypothetical protein